MDNTAVQDSIAVAAAVHTEQDAEEDSLHDFVDCSEEKRTAVHRNSRCLGRLDTLDVEGCLLVDNIQSYGMAGSCSNDPFGGVLNFLI